MQAHAGTCRHMRIHALVWFALAQAKLRPPLLALLGDADAGLRGRALQFWHSALPRALGPRLRALLADSLEQPGAWVRSDSVLKLIGLYKTRAQTHPALSCAPVAHHASSRLGVFCLGSKGVSVTAAVHAW